MIWITLLIIGSRTIAQKVLAGELELGVVGAKWNETGLEWKEMFADELVCLGRASPGSAGNRNSG